MNSLKSDLSSLKEEVASGKIIYDSLQLPQALPEGYVVTYVLKLHCSTLPATRGKILSTWMLDNWSYNANSYTVTIHSSSEHSAIISGVEIKYRVVCERIDD